MSQRPARQALTSGLAVAALGLLTACGPAGPMDASAAAARSPYAVASESAAPAAAPPTATSAPSVAPLSRRLRPDVVVTGKQSFSAAGLARLTKLSPRYGAAVYRAGTVHINGRPVQAVAVDPSTFRRFTAQGTAEADLVWESVARGEAVLSHSLATSMSLGLGGEAPLVRPGGAPFPLRIGAFATTGIPGTDLIVSDALGAKLGLAKASAMLLTGDTSVDPVVLAGKVRRVTGDGGTVDLLTPPTVNPVAFLTGGKAAKAFGAFSYRYYDDGTIQPDARWVRENIVTATVPVFGRVTCHRLMVPQLRGALAEVEAEGLAGSLHTYNGCYVPRFIERNPTRSISLHTWGIAIDLDSATNYRGIAGTMDPKVVAIFKKWGFRWGGDWTYTDPMHFELGALLSTPRR